MVTEIMAAISSVRLLGDVAQKGYQMRNSNEINTAIAEALSKLNAAWTAALDAQGKQAMLQEDKATFTERISELEKEIAELKDWKREAEGYTLTEIASGIPTHILQSEIERGAITHRLCANCFARNKKSFLQRGSAGQWGCSECKGQWFPSGSGSMRRVVRR